MKRYELFFTHPNNSTLRLDVNEKEVFKFLAHYWIDNGNSPLSVEIKEVEFRDEE